MGEVYKAYDDRLDRWVAIKRIRPDRLDSDDNRERFKREARATAKLNHPAIVHLYGILEDGDADCIVMEYVEGQTLDRLIDTGPLEPGHVARLGHEIALGLAEAHAAGILHRDLKAENIILTARRGRAKILDFGLAKPILDAELDPILTGKGQLVGTSRSMSPEYVGGEAVDHRSDIFSLGVMLYEALTGQSPFKAHNTLATLKQVMLHRQTPAHQMRAAVPVELSELVDRLLEKDPEDRPQSAEEVAAAFGRLVPQIASGLVEMPASGGYDHLSATTSTTVSAMSASDTMLDLRPPRRWMTVLAILVGLLIGAFALGWILRRDEPPTTVAIEDETVRILLGDFQNQTAEEVFDATLRQAFRVGIEQSRHVQALSPSGVREALGRMERAPDTAIDRDVGVELARRENAHRLVLGGIASVGSRYLLTAEVVDPATDATVFTYQEQARDQDAVLGKLDTLTREVRSHLGESAAQIQRDSNPLERVTTANIEALEAYTAGVGLMEEGESEEALPFFQRAVELDPSFAMAHAKLIVIYSRLEDVANANRHVDLALANEGRLTDVERFYVKGWAARWRGSPEDELENWRLMSQFHPETFTAHINLGFSHIVYSLDYASANAAFRKALETATITTQRDLALQYLGRCSLALQDLSAAESTIGLISDPLLRLTSELDLYRARGRFENAPPATEAFNHDPGISIRLALIALDRGALQDAQLGFDRLAARSLLSAGEESQYLLQSALAISSLQLLNVEDIHTRSYPWMPEAIEQARASVYPESRRPGTSSITFLASLGKIAIRLGTEQGLREARIYRSWIGDPPSHSSTVWNAYITMLDAEILIAEGKAKEAVELLQARRPRTAPALQLRETLRYALNSLDRAADGAVGQRLDFSDLSGLASVECLDNCYGNALHAVIMTRAQAQYRDGLS
ncbi:MAG: protein kinase [Acidobacteriota bacterium]